MFIDLKQLFDVVGSQRNIDQTIQFLEQDQHSTFPQPVEVHGELVNQAGVLLMELDVSAVAKLVCDRCLDGFDLPINQHFSHLLASRQISPNDDVIVVEDGRLDLDDLIWNDLFLSLPTKSLCREDCKGLCMHCGANLNIDSCDCDKT